MAEDIHLQKVNPDTVLEIGVAWIAPNADAREESFLKNGTAAALQFCLQELLTAILAQKPEIQCATTFHESEKQAVRKAADRAAQLDSTLLIQPRSLTVRDDPAARVVNCLIILHLSVRDEEGTPFVVVMAENWRFVPIGKSSGPVLTEGVLKPGVEKGDARALSAETRCRGCGVALFGSQVSRGFCASCEPR